MLNLVYFFRFLECGHFCLNYVLRKEKQKRQVKYNKQMMSLGLVKRVLEQYFLQVECLKIAKISDINSHKRFITLLKRKNGLHYVVVERREKEKIYYYDPAFLFIRKIKVSDFRRKWSHYCCFYGAEIKKK